MIKHTQTISWQKPMNYLKLFDLFVGLALKGLKSRMEVKATMKISTTEKDFLGQTLLGDLC